MAQTDRHIHGHGDLLSNSAQWARVGENAHIQLILFCSPFPPISDHIMLLFAVFNNTLTRPCTCVSLVNYLSLNSALEEETIPQCL